MPHPSEAHYRFRDQVRRLVAEKVAPYAAQMDEEEGFPRVSYEAFRDAGFFKAALPKEYGGLGADALMLCMLIEEISRVSPSSALLVFPTSALIRILSYVGTQEQKDRFFPRMAKGDVISAFVLTESGSGSDAGSLKLRAEREDGYYRFQGSKAYITLGEHAHYYLVFVRTGTQPRAEGVSAFIVERESEGLSFGTPMKKMGLGASVTQELFFDSVRVPEDNLLLGPERGWEVLTRYAGPMRVWGAAGMSLGIAQGAFEEALSHAKTRVQFKSKLARFQAVAFMLVDMYTRIEAARSLVYRTATMVDDPSVEFQEVETFVSMSKFYTSDMAMDVTTDAVQILGASGSRRGCRVERLMRDAKAIQIFDGSNQIQRLIAARNILRQKREDTHAVQSQ